MQRPPSRLSLRSVQAPRRGPDVIPCGVWAATVEAVVSLPASRGVARLRKLEAICVDHPKMIVTTQARRSPSRGGPKRYMSSSGYSG